MKKKSLITLFIAFSIFLTYALPCNAEPWKETFDRLCGYVEEAESMPTDELKKIITDCDSFLGTLKELDAPEKKSYVFRMEKCRKFYQYILDLRDAEAEP